MMKKRQWSAEEKKQIIEAALEPGASVGEIARNHGVAASLVYVWRKQHRAGKKAAKGTGAARLLPVAVTGEQPSLEMELPKGRLRVAGVDAALLRAVLEMLQ